jgi:hypothetical protein
VKLECLRLLATLRLDPGKARLIAAFVDTYLNLRGRERRLFGRKVRAMPANEREGVMEFTTSWHEAGRREGAAQIALRQLRRRFGTLPDKMSQRIESLRLTQLEQLAEDLLDFRSAADLDVWLAARKTKRGAVRRKSKV